MLMLLVTCIISQSLISHTITLRWMTELDVEVGKTITVACLGSSTAAALATCCMTASLIVISRYSSLLC